MIFTCLWLGVVCGLILSFCFLLSQVVVSLRGCWLSMRVFFRCCLDSVFFIVFIFNDMDCEGFSGVLVMLYFVCD